MSENLETIILAGGCFWCSEAVFRRVKGVAEVTSGYANGKMENPTFEDVSSGETGAAEAVQIKFDPKVVSFQKLLDIFWATHDPTTLNRQGLDVGTQYRSAIYYTNENQKEIAEKSRELQEEREVAGRPIVTEVAPLRNFYTAEQYHQEYFEKNRITNPYCSLVIAPKIQKLLEKFNSEVKEEYRA